LVNSSQLAISWFRYGAWLLPTMLPYGSFSSTITTSLPLWAVAVAAIACEDTARLVHNTRPVPTRAIGFVKGRRIK